MSTTKSLVHVNGLRNLVLILNLGDHNQQLQNKSHISLKGYIKSLSS